MSHPPPGALAGYSSLGDKYLAGYFGNSKMKKHLKKSGLVSRDGTVVEDNTYRLKMAKKEHRKHVRDMLATAIVHKALDMERMHQYEMKKKLEELYKVELVQRIRAERSRKGEEEALNLLPNRPHRETSNVRGARQRGSVQSPNSLPDIHYDKTQNRLHYQEKPTRRDGAEMSKSREHPLQRSYVQPHPPAKKKKKKSKTHRGLILAKTDSAVAHRIQLQSLAEVTVKYLGSSLNLSSDATFKNHLEEVTVYQQHCGGSTLCVFKELLSPGTQFSFISRRHRGSPFGLTFYTNGLQDCRLSSCCEYKHRPGQRIGGKHGRFAIVDITGAAPCYKCQVSLAMAESRKKKRDEKQDSEQSSSESDEEGPQVSYDIIVSTLKREDNEEDKKKDEKRQGDGKDEEDDSLAKETPKEEGKGADDEENDTGSSQEQEQNDYEEEGFEDDKDDKDKVSEQSDADSVVSSLSSSDSSSSSSDEEIEDERKSDAGDKERSGSENDNRGSDNDNTDEEREHESGHESESKEAEDVREGADAMESKNEDEETTEKEQVSVEDNVSSDDKEETPEEELVSTADKEGEDVKDSEVNDNAADQKIISTDDEGIQEDPSKEEPPIEEEDKVAPFSSVIDRNESPSENEVPEQLSEDDGRTMREAEIQASEVISDAESEKSEGGKLLESTGGDEVGNEQNENESIAEVPEEDVNDTKIVTDSEEPTVEDSTKAENMEEKTSVTVDADLGLNEERDSEEKERVDDTKIASDEEDEVSPEKKRNDDSDSSSSSSSSSDEDDADKEEKVKTKAEGSSSDSDSRALDRGNDPDAVALEEKPAIKPPSVEPAEKCEGSILPLLNSSTEVELSNIALNKDQVLEIANLLQANEATDSLSLRNAQLDNEAVTVLMDSVKTASSLKMLNLNLNDIGPDGARQIVHSLADNNELSILMMHGNPLGDEGVEIITSFLKTSKTISSLDLGGCQFGEKGLESIGSLLEETDSLTDLNLTGNHIPFEGWKAFSKSLSSNETVKALSLDYTQLGDAGIEILADPGLMSNKSLRSIDLEGNGITDSGAEILLRVLEENHTIVDITLTPMNFISADLLDKIKSILADRID